MHPGISRHTATALVLAACGTLAGAAHAQASAATWSTFGSLTAVHQADADLDGGGDYSASSAILRVGVLGDLGAGRRAGLVFNYDYTDYDFSAPAAFGGMAPWGAVQRYGVAAPLSYTRADGWSLGLTPSVDWIGENGADSGESLTWGAIATATRFFADGNRIGFGLAAFDRLDETRVFPLLLVDWRLSDRWRLGNPLPAGPTGPAGLELVYRINHYWLVLSIFLYMELTWKVLQLRPRQLLRILWLAWLVVFIIVDTNLLGISEGTYHRPDSSLPTLSSV